MPHKEQCDVYRKLQQPIQPPALILLGEFFERDRAEDGYGQTDDEPRGVGGDWNEADESPIPIHSHTVLQRKDHCLLFGQHSRGCEAIIFPFRLFSDVHCGRVGEKEYDGYDRNVYSRDPPKDEKEKKEEKCGDYRAAGIFSDIFNGIGDALFDFVYDVHRSFGLLCMVKERIGEFRPLRRSA